MALDADGSVVQERRYYDRARWFAPLAELPWPFAGIRDVPARPGPVKPRLEDRAAAWNAALRHRRDLGADLHTLLLIADAARIGRSTGC